MSWNATPAASAGPRASAAGTPSRKPHTGRHANPTADATRNRYGYRSANVAKRTGSRSVSTPSTTASRYSGGTP